jgi:dTDP-4-dehydrorhamnose 3,5-epimerase
MLEVKRVLTDCLILQPQVFGDIRGEFAEAWNERVFNETIGRNVRFVQDNQSTSVRGVLRGLHYQTSSTQGKLVRVCDGEVIDVAVDLRADSPTFGQWHAEVLSAKNFRMFWIPEGFAHGFLVRSESSKVLYKTTDYYQPEFETSLSWDDPYLNIDWQLNGLDPVLSEKDRNGTSFECAYKFK